MAKKPFESPRMVAAARAVSSAPGKQASGAKLLRDFAVWFVIPMVKCAARPSVCGFVDRRLWLALIALFAPACSRARAEQAVEEFVFPEMVIRASPPPKRHAKPAKAKKPPRAPREFR